MLPYPPVESQFLGWGDAVYEIGGWILVDNRTTFYFPHETVATKQPQHSNRLLHADLSGLNKEP